MESLVFTKLYKHHKNYRISHCVCIVLVGTQHVGTQNSLVKNAESMHIHFFFIQFYVPFKLYHSYRDGSIGRWGENRSTRGKTT